VVTINELEYPDDINNDNFGKWEHLRSHLMYYRMQVEHDNDVNVENCAPCITGDNVALFPHLHSVHPSTHNLEHGMHNML